MSRLDIGEEFDRTGKLEEALASYGKAMAIYQELVKAYPGVSVLQLDLANCHAELGALLARQKRFAEAFTHLDAGLAIQQKLAEGDPKNPIYVLRLGYSYGYRGWALVRSGQPSEAAADLRRAFQLWEKTATDPNTQFARSQALALLAGLGGEAKSGVTKEEARTFADQAVTDLTGAVKGGWCRPGELKGSDFDALRGRPDFQKLVAEVESKSGLKAKPKD